MTTPTPTALDAGSEATGSPSGAPSVSAPWSLRHGYARLIHALNTRWHELALRVFVVIVLAHWAEHLVQVFQIYALGWRLPDARGVLGIPFPWLVKSEFMHYAYALVMLAGIWILRRGFTGRAATWWGIALGIQSWHHVEHALLQYQVIAGHNFFGAPAPISVIQMLGFLEGDAASGFQGLMAGPPVRPLSPLVFLVRRVEVHMIYNALVFAPMVAAMYLHLFPNAAERSGMRCACALDRHHGVPS
jgi:hypothetical protein